MSATTMNPTPSRRQRFTSGPSSPDNNNKRRKEEERDGLDGFKTLAITTKNLAKPSIHRAPTPVKPPPQRAACNNQLLAGYLAHEFLTRGTLFGETFDPARAEEAFPVASSSSSRGKRKAEPSVKDKDDEKRVEKQQRYLEVADLLKGDGAHLRGIVNPTQLARFLQLGG